ncbi:uncharacterized protein G2W53_010280 [Senna tora]|uniref:Uncharacterized protein n=1 Tax=Senna tora TaxID=362788 RepID=A0A835C965_9FABA|nr:uncharacterized protein G2W53_010280 [Senna tora]
MKVSDIRPSFVVRNMLRRDPRSSHAMTTPIGASKPHRAEYVKTLSTPLPCPDDSNWSIKSTPVRKYKGNRRVSLTWATSVLPRNS